MVYNQALSFGKAEIILPVRIDTASLRRTIRMFLIILNEYQHSQKKLAQIKIFPLTQDESNL